MCSPPPFAPPDSVGSERSIAHANRPDRRAVLDRERARAVAEKQAEALRAARELAEKKSREKIQVSYLVKNQPRRPGRASRARTVLYPRIHHLQTLGVGVGVYLRTCLKVGLRERPRRKKVIIEKWQVLPCV